MSSDPVLFEAINSTLTVERRGERALLVTIVGRDVGELGDVPFLELQKHLSTVEHPELFVDARAARGPSVDVSNAWANFLVQERGRYTCLHMLTGSRLVHVTATFVRRFTELGEQMRLYTDPLLFEAALTRATGSK